MRYAIILAFLIAASGCVSQSASYGGLVVSMFADPPQVFQNQATTLFIDIDNRDVKKVNNVVFEVFDTGIMRIMDGTTVSACRKSFPKLVPKEFQTFSCRLAAGSVGETIVNRISAKTTFSAELNAVQLIEMISRQEYERRKAAGTFITAPRKYTYSDSNVALDIEFSEDMPVIERSGKRYFIHMTVRNTGNGYIRELEPGDFIVTQKTSESLQILPDIETVSVINTQADNLVRCDDFGEKLSPIGDKFPRVTCEFVPPKKIGVIGNYPMEVKINYDYETRQNLNIRIIK